MATYKECLPEELADAQLNYRANAERINAELKAGELGEATANMDRLINEYGVELSPRMPLYRVGSAPADVPIGAKMTDRGFNSLTADIGNAKSKLGQNQAVFRVRNLEAERAIPGERGDTEFVFHRNMQYTVTNSSVMPDGTRVIDVDMRRLDKPAPAPPPPPVRIPEPARSVPVAAPTAQPSRTVLDPKQYDALKPTADRYSKARDTAAVRALRSTPEGAALHETLSSWQYSHASNVTRIRNNVAKRLNGELTTGKAADDADRLIAAIRNSPLHPPELYRGMKIPGTTQEVLAKFKGQAELDINVSSFTSKQSVAANFMVDTEGQKVKSGQATGVFMIVEQSDGGKALPIEGISGGAGIWQEREWISGGRYEVISAGANAAGQVIIRLRQLSVLGD